MWSAPGISLMLLRRTASSLSLGFHCVTVCALLKLSKIELQVFACFLNNYYICNIFAFYFDDGCIMKGISKRKYTLQGITQDFPDNTPIFAHSEVGPLEKDCF